MCLSALLHRRMAACERGNHSGVIQVDQLLICYKILTTF